MFLSMMVLVMMMICFDFALFHYCSDGDGCLSLFSSQFSLVNLYLIDSLGHSVMDCQFPMVWWLVNFVAKQVDYFYWYYCYRCCQRCPPLQPAVATITTTLWTKLKGMYKCTFFYEEISVCMCVWVWAERNEKKNLREKVRRHTNAYTRKCKESENEGETQTGIRSMSDCVGEREKKRDKQNIHTNAVASMRARNVYVWTGYIVM